MLFYFYSFDRNGNRKMRTRAFWYITGNKIIFKKSNLQAVKGQILQVISEPQAYKAQHVLLLKGLTGIVDAVFKALVFYESVIIFALCYYNIIRSLSCCQDWSDNIRALRNFSTRLIRRDTDLQHDSCKPLQHITGALWASAAWELVMQILALAPAKTGSSGVRASLQFHQEFARRGFKNTLFLFLKKTTKKPFESAKMTKLQSFWLL